MRKDLAKSYIVFILIVLLLSPIIGIYLLEINHQNLRADVDSHMIIGFFSGFAFFLRSHALKVFALVATMVGMLRVKSKLVVVAVWVIIGIFAVVGVSSSLVVTGKAYVIYENSWSGPSGWLRKMGIQFW
ncbi:MAG: hypothetical protein V4584_07430 [Verrucomicrobiota bacterium]